ncbi:hypothetical protein Tco_0806430 [Tanacetum coccineum]
MARIRDDTSPRIVKPTFGDVVHFELQGHFLKELRENIFSGTDNEDSNEHVDKVLEIINLFHELNVNEDQLMRKVGGNSEGLATITAQLSSLVREMKKLYKQVHYVPVSYKLCHVSHLSSDFSNKERVKEAEEVYYGEFYRMYFQNRGRYKANASGYYVKEENKIGYQERKLSLKETLNKFMEESAKRDKENIELIKEVQAITQAEIRNQEASLKTMKDQIGQLILFHVYSFVCSHEFHVSCFQLTKQATHVLLETFVHPGQPLLHYYSYLMNHA